MLTVWMLLVQVEDSMLCSLVDGDFGGSSQCSMKDVGRMLSNVGEFISKPGGSIANMTRGLASGFGIKCNLVGVRGNDEWGVMFKSSMRRAQVNLDGLITKVKQSTSSWAAIDRAFSSAVIHAVRLNFLLQDGSTARCVIFAHNGQRTMRTCFEKAVRLDVDSVTEACFQGCKWTFVSCYALYTEGLLARVLELAENAGTRVALDLAGGWRGVRAGVAHLSCAWLVL
jgi:sugar/nucleoside kinase (ribokinase family)